MPPSPNDLSAERPITAADNGGKVFELIRAASCEYGMRSGKCGSSRVATEPEQGRPGANLSQSVLSPFDKQALRCAIISARSIKAQVIVAISEMDL